MCSMHFRFNTTQLYDLLVNFVLSSYLVDLDSNLFWMPTLPPYAQNFTGERGCF